VLGNVSWSGQTLPRPKFPEAAARFESTRQEIGGVDFLCTMYRLRCSAYEQKPPPDDWDGSFALAESEPPLAAKHHAGFRNPLSDNV